MTYNDRTHHQFSTNHKTLQIKIPTLHYQSNNTLNLANIASNHHQSFTNHNQNDSKKQKKQKKKPTNSNEVHHLAACELGSG